LIQKALKTQIRQKKGYDGGKKISGIKIHTAVDVIGLPYALFVTTANVTDRDGAIQMFSENEFNLPSLQKILADGGYTGEKFAAAMQNLTGATVEVTKRSELHKFVVIPKRWVVERSFAWLDKCRRLWKNCERYLDNTLNMVKLAFLSILLRRI
jgi:transposase